MRAKARHFRLSQLSTLNSQLAFTFFPPSPSAIAKRLAHGKSYPSYSSATAPDSHGISCADPLFQARKELDREVAACARRCKTFFVVIQLASPQTAGQVQQLSRRPPALLPVRRKLEGSHRVSPPQ